MQETWVWSLCQEDPLEWNPLQYSCLKNSMDRGTWQATAHGVTKSWTLSDWTHTSHFLGGLLLKNPSVVSTCQLPSTCQCIQQFWKEIEAGWKSGVPRAREMTSSEAGKGSGVQGMWDEKCELKNHTKGLKVQTAGNIFFFWVAISQNFFFLPLSRFNF